MFRLLFLTLTATLFSAFVSAQCLTDFKKLLPEEGIIYDKFVYGDAVSIWDDVLAIGSYNSDTLGLTQAGVVYVYTKGLDGKWNSVGLLKPSTPAANMHFGKSVQVTENYIVVGGAWNESVYIFRKPAGGWTTTTETAVMQPPPGSGFFGNSWDFDESQGLLAVHDSGYEQGTGVLYIYHKPVAQEWDGSIVPQVIQHPHKADGDHFFGIGGVQIYSNRIASGSFTGIGYSRDVIYIFRDQSGTLDNYQLEAELAPSVAASNYFYGQMFQFNETGIIRYSGGTFRIYDTPASGVWANDSPYCEWTPPPIDGLVQGGSNMVAYGENIYVSSRLSDNSSRLLVYTRNGGSWCSNASMTTLYTEPAPADGGGSQFQLSLSTYKDEEITFAWTSGEADGLELYASVGIMDIASHSTEYLSQREYSAEDASHGSSIWVYGDVLFASAINEYVGGKKLGAVYIYQKGNGQWQQVNKLSLPGDENDHAFGGFVTGNGEFVAFSGLGYSPEKILIYKKDGADLTHPVLWQTLDIPGSATESYDYTKPVMTNQWLVVPVANYTDGSEYLVFYKKNQDGQWSFTQKLKIGTLFVLFKRPHHIAMYGNTLAATNGFDKVFILEIDSQTALWTITQTLKASDPDSDMIFPPFNGVPGLFLDASYFGSSIAMNENQIFVGAPGKNDGATLDVGAIYVYTKPKGGWTSTTETKKLLPTSKDASTLLGTELMVKNNMLAAAATSSSTPGSVYIFETFDYAWSNIIQLLRLTGDTFAFDGYGATLALHDTDFFVGAPRETNTMGTAAGAVYVTPAPPTIKLEPPICVTTQPYDFFGYPFGGVWSGDGITDATRGTFDPSIAGNGVHELMYTTPNCYYPGKLQITISTEPVAEPENPTEMTLCDEGVISVNLGLKVEEEVLYRWFYREGAGDPWVAMPEATTNEITVTNTQTGGYRVEADNNFCIVANEFVVKKESMTLTLQQPPGICDKTERISLEATPTGGTWTVAGVSKTLVDDGDPPTLRVNELNDGNYVLSYSYKSPKQCIYSKSTSLSIDRVGEPSLVSEASGICKGSVNLSLKDLKLTDNVEWFKDGSPIGVTGTSLSTAENGSYYVLASKNGCAFETNIVVVNNGSAIPFQIANVITPNGDAYNEDLQVLGDNLRDFSIIVINRSGKEVFRSDNANFKWNAPDMPAGVYYYIAKYTDCSNEEKTNRGWLSVVR